MSGGINALPNNNVIVDKQGRLITEWQAFLSSVHDWLGPVGQSGTITNRPPDSTTNPLYVGQGYFDTTLGKPIWVKSRNPTVWVDATGSSV